MKRIFTLLFLSLFLATGSFAQKSYVNYSRDSKWFIGINAGATWHSRTEVDNLIKGGYGFTFGRSFGMRPEKLFSWDLRFRYLHGWWGGQSTSLYSLDSNAVANMPDTYPKTTVLQTYQDTSGGFVPNFRTQLLSGSLELALNTNRLRQNTGWNFQIFGGIGVKGYNTKADLTDEFGNIYDYSTFGNNKIDYLTAQDGNYETDITGSDANFHVDWMGSFGAGISYQVAPWASIGISHKMTWTRNDDMFDGMPNLANGSPSPSNDIYHYSSAGIRFHLFGGNNNTVIKDPIVEDTTNINNFDVIDDPVVTNPVIQQPPVVDIYDPGTSPYTVEYDHFTLRARVHNVNGKQNITFKQNGNFNNNFSYNATSDEFASTVLLQPGQNIFEITGVNTAGQDYESTIIIYKKEQPTLDPPIVTITNPPYSPYTTANNLFSFASTVLNVDSKAQIKVYFNGNYLPDFTYNTSTKALYATLHLVEGTNSITVTATNAAGSDSKTAKIIYDKPEQIQPPVVNIINPSNNPHSTNVNSKSITATVLNVASKNDIIVEVNGHPTTNFTFNNNTKQVNFTASLLEGANVVQVTGSNQAGVDQDQTTIIYTKPEAPKPPVVTYIDPAVDPTIVYSSTYNVTAKVLNVNSASDIKLKINGVQSYNFAYSASSDLMTFTTNLVLGSNVIEITATNNVGQDIETTTIIQKRVVPQAPPIVDITYPGTDNMVYTTPNITLFAKVLNVNSPNNITVTVNGNSTAAFNYNTATKILQLPLVLNEGVNNVTITGTNTSGSDTDTRLIIYKKPQQPTPPTVNFVNPATSPYLVTVENYTITANTTHIDDKSQIIFKQNGVLIQNAQYTFTANHQIIYNAQLIPGSNVFEVNVTNNDGTASDLAIVTYKVETTPCIIPTVGYISPVPYSTVNDPNVNIEAQINNYSNGTTVELILNGVSQGYMAFNQNTSLATLPAVLSEGSNSVKIVVTNSCGTNHATFTLNYVAPEAPCIDPTLTAIGGTSITTQEDKITLQVGVTEIQNQASILAMLNDQTTQFTYDAGTHTITLTDLPLNIGQNMVVLTAVNDCGTANLTINIQREQCNLPVISNINPANGNSVTTENVAFSAKVDNAIASEVELVVNGISQQFNFNAQTHVLTANIPLNIGANVVVIDAQNACGRANKSVTYNRTIPCENIAYSLVHPSTLNATVTDANYSVLLHVTGTLQASGITATVNGSNATVNFDQVAGNITLSGITLNEGANAIVINLTNDCSSQSVTYSVTYEPEVEGPCGPRFNPGNSEWQFCLVTPNGTYNRDNLANNPSFTYSGPATAAYFMPIAGGGDAVVNGQAYSVQAGQYYLFEGNLTVDVASNHPGSMGQWEICINADAVPQHGNGNNRPPSPCEAPPCDPVSFNMMQPSSNSATVTDANYTITANIAGVSGQNQITVKQNGTNIPFTYDAGTQIISVNNITLVDGQNNFIITGTNDCSNETLNYQIQYNGCQAPVISLGTNATSVTTAQYTFSAAVTNISNANQIQVLHNNAPVTIVFDQNTGSIGGEVTLIEGQNDFVINANGCEITNTQFSVTYTIPCQPIVYSLSNPAQNSTSSASEVYSIELVAQNVNPATIEVKLNGATIPHTFGNDIIGIGNIQLIDGANTVTVTMSNACSNETVTYTIQHDGCDAPVINLGNNSDAVTNPAYNFAATVTNIDNQNQIQLTLNGTSSNFTFDAGTGALSAQLQLQEGQNTIVITANGCTNASNTFNVGYTVPCNPVSYTLVNPQNASTAVTEANFNLSLTAQNASNVSATLNGTAVNPQFNAQNGSINLSGLTLVAGANQIVVSLSNNCSNETVTYNVTYNEPAGPCGPRFNPGNSAWEFCLITPNGTYTRDDLANNPSFSYAGPATSAYFKPIAGGGNAIVNGQDLTLDNGKYYLFTGNLTVDVSSNHPGSMGHWEICITSNNAPTSGNGNNRPQSPCEGDPTGGNNTGGSGFDIQGNGTVQVNNDVCATIKCLGESVVYNNSQEAFVKVEYSVNGGSTWYSFNNGNNVAGGEQLTAAANNGAQIVLKATCTNQQGNWTNTEISNTNSQYVYVLKNGDQAPNFAPAQGQASVETFLAGVVDGQGNVSIGPNDVIYLFELRHVGNYGVDYQDCVMLITLDENGNCSPPSNPTGSGNNHGQVYLTPKFTNISPSSISISSREQSFDLKTKVENINEKADLQLIVNGIQNKVFDYNLDNQLMTAKLKLQEGNNIVKIIATNGNKKQDMTYTIKYEPQQVVTNTVIAPAITNITPSTTSSKTGSTTYAFKAKVDNVTNKNQIKLTLNGQAVTTFTYSTSTKQVSAVLQLRAGSNSIKLDATNGDKNASRTYTVNYEAKEVINTTVLKPEITAISPSTNVSTVNTPSLMFKAKVTNVSGKTGIQIKVNGAPYTTFSYSTATGQLTAVVNLRQGANTISVSAVNGNLSEQKTFTITYTPKTTTIDKNTNGGSRPNGGSTNTKTTTSGGTKTTGGTTTTSGGTKTTTTSGGSKTTTTSGGSTTKTTGGTTTTSGGTKTTGGSTTKTTGGTTTTSGGTKTTGGSTTKTTGGNVQEQSGGSRRGGI
ncbi:hypothetical protein K6119_10510 [Paracrocinitomix mangrovi]|uniref:hypothetical protein n=1 Tax=Paracrocinitomix mangrovi TaxID=2862509 RepID=UPI001C8D4BB9|nr:hypothetical protein [Paracrocinitomix mangrovi]UKN00165.1 hypothetical protein K6119_10510 [Paracrocinitomix mangrovi]